MERLGGAAKFLAGAITGSLFVSVAVAAMSSSSPINACVNNTNGQVRIVTSAADCKPGERPLSWNQQGPPGQPGLSGYEVKSKEFVLPVRDGSAVTGPSETKLFCSPGKQPFGGGWEDPSDQITVFGDAPVTSDPSGLKGWEVFHAPNTSLSPVKLVIWVTCASVT